MNVLSPTEWGSRVDYDKWTDKFTPDDGVALHHGGGSNYPAGVGPYSQLKEKTQLRAWEAFHIDGRGWRGLAYGWAVGQTGTIYRARGFNTYGAHTGDVDGDGIANNVEVVPILFIGSGHHHDLSPDAEKAVEWLRREVIEARSPKAVWLYGHQELKGTKTSCPGPKLMGYVRSHRRLETSPMGWNKPGDPVENLDDARKVFEWMGPEIYKAADFAYDENDPALLDERSKILLARVADEIMKLDVRIRNLGG